MSPSFLSIVLIRGLIWSAAYNFRYLGSWYTSLVVRVMIVSSLWYIGHPVIVLLGSLVNDRRALHRIVCFSSCLISMRELLNFQPLVVEMRVRVM